MKRTERARARMKQLRLDAVLFTDLMNIRYVSGFTGSAATVIITSERAIILVDSRYVLQAGQECPRYEVIQYVGDVLKAAADLLNERTPGRVGFEANQMTYSAHRKLRNNQRERVPQRHVVIGPELVEIHIS